MFTKFKTTLGKYKKRYRNRKLVMWMLERFGVEDLDEEGFKELCNCFVAGLVKEFRNGNEINLEEFYSLLHRVDERYPALVKDLGILPTNEDQLKRLYAEVKADSRVDIHETFERVLLSEMSRFKWRDGLREWQEEQREVVAVTPSRLGADEWWFTNSWVPRARIMEYLVYLARMKGLETFSPTTILKFCQIYLVSEECRFDFATSVHCKYNDVRVGSPSSEESQHWLRGFPTMECKNGKIILMRYPTNSHILHLNKPILFLRRVQKLGEPQIHLHRFTPHERKYP